MTEIQSKARPRRAMRTAAALTVLLGLGTAAAVLWSPPSLGSREPLPAAPDAGPQTTVFAVG